MRISNHQNTVRLFLDPPMQLMGHSRWQRKILISHRYTLFMVLILEVIWNLKNFVAHMKKKVTAQSQVQVSRQKIH